MADREPEPTPSRRAVQTRLAQADEREQEAADRDTEKVDASKMVLASDVVEADEEGLPVVVAKRGETAPKDLGDEEQLVADGLVVPAGMLPENQDQWRDATFRSYSSSEAKAALDKAQALNDDDKLQDVIDAQDKEQVSRGRQQFTSLGG